MFHRKLFLLQLPGQALSAILTDIIEESARSKSSERFLTFEFEPGNALSLEEGPVGGEILFSVALERAMVRFQAEVISSHSNEIAVRPPREVTFITSRENHRFNAKQLSPRICNVAVTSDSGERVFGSFELIDLSSDGVGGILSLPCPELPFKNPRIQGKLLQEYGAIVLDGKVSWITTITSSARGSRYKVGLKNWDQDNNSTDNPSIFERRNTQRLRADFPIEVVSPLFPQTAAILQLEDLSLSGLRARFLNVSDNGLFRPGLEVTLVSPKLRLLVKSVNTQQVTFKVLRSALDEHIRLFNQQSFLNNRDLASGTHISSDVTQVYTTSGAFSTSLAKSLSHNREHIFRSTLKPASQVPWFLRWLQQAEDGRIRAVFLSAPYSDHIWYVGGLAGHIDSELKMSSDFVARFFQGMQSFFSSLESPEYFVINWFKTNSWWNGWEAWLEKQPEDTDLFRFEGDIVYINNLSNFLYSEKSEPQPKELTPGNVEELEATVKAISSKPIRRLMEALGLGAFGSRYAATSELLGRTNHHFCRRFYRVILSDCTVIVMLSAFPSNVFLNGILNYPFVYATRQLCEDELNILADRISYLATMMGIECPAFFLTINGLASQIRETDALIFKEVIWTFGNSRTLEYWSNL